MSIWKAIGAGALAVGFYANAHAANADMDIFDWVETSKERAALCHTITGNNFICWMRGERTEKDALKAAVRVVEMCRSPLAKANLARECAEAEAYIKERWGY
jgi:hypothetical protein